MRTARAPQMEPENDEEKITLPSRYSPEGLVCRLILKSHFNADFISIRETADGSETWRIVLRKKFREEAVKK